MNNAMICIKCNANIPEDSAYCNICGAKQSSDPHARKPKSRGNGQGTVYKRGRTYTAYLVRYANGHCLRATKGGFKTRKEAYAYMPKLHEQLLSPVPRSDLEICFADLYEKFIELHSRRVSKSTLDCYKAAYKYYDKVYYLPFAQLTTEQFQACIDACPHGRRTKENMKALGTLLSSYAMQLGITNKDYAQFVFIERTEKNEKRPFTADEIQKLFEHADTVTYADYILILIYTGFRINEMLPLTLDDYDAANRCFIGGEKTEAGKNRIVPVSPKIQPYVDSIVQAAQNNSTGYLFTNPQGNKMSADNFRKKWMPEALRACGVDDTLTPHQCRHTFATLMKSVSAPETDKMRLIGHASYEMTAHYTHADISSLRNIVEKI